ncbi:hypothetical protein AB0L54_36835, partial [Streptomyces sp. NPDC052196]|uniref:hypothetical protein n=1 Tax=Streptomyces sp. NPDC052196 TaxID=3156691 RepID=UPI0034400AC6
MTSVPGQVSAGPIDGFLRDNAGDGTLGLPDYSLTPYTYLPMLGPADSSPQWVIDRYRSTQTAAFKGDPNGLGAGRSASAVGLTVVPQTTGTITASPDGGQAPQYTWGPRDFAIGVRLPSGNVPSDIRSYVAFTQADSSIGMRLTTSASLAPWDAQRADSTAATLNVVNLWDGNPHTFHVSSFGSNVFCLIDGAL